MAQCAVKCGVKTLGVREHSDTLVFERVEATFVHVLLGEMRRSQLMEGWDCFSVLKLVSHDRPGCLLA